MARIGDQAMKLVRKTYTTRREKVVDFVIGIVGWIVINAIMAGMMWALQWANSALYERGLTPILLNFVSPFIACLPIIVNIVSLILLGLTRYWTALGALAAFAALQLLVICLGVIVGVVCFAILLSTARAP